MNIYYELVNGKGQSTIPELRHKHSEDQKKIKNFKLWFIGDKNNSTGESL